MITVATIAELRSRCDHVRRDGGSVGFVPTMGALHEGHLTLIRTARAQHDFVVVSLFVNPTQFGPTEDLAAYPRDRERDAAAAAGSGADVLFAPAVEEMYPRVALTTVTVTEVTEELCGRARPHHFGGVATIVTKLFSIVGPCTSYFGKKDFQQLVVVRRLAEDLDLPVTVVGVTTVRELDGLAMSSRNTYLSPDERQAATVLFRSLQVALKTVLSGERDPVRVREAVVDLVAAEPKAQLEYAEVLRADDLGRISSIEDGVEHAVVLAAVVGGTRLLDNVTFSVEGRTIHSDTETGET
jgi:pantoate--beta-alanine ligase